jgi:hypothetical protein
MAAARAERPTSLSRYGSNVVGTKIEDATKDGRGFAIAHSARCQNEPVGHARMQEQLTALAADIGVNGDDGDIVALANGPLDFAIVGKLAAAPWTPTDALFAHGFTRLR